MKHQISIDGKLLRRMIKAIVNEWAIHACGYEKGVDIRVCKDGSVIFDIRDDSGNTKCASINLEIICHFLSCYPEHLDKLIEDNHYSDHFDSMMNDYCVWYKKRYPLYPSIKNLRGRVYNGQKA